MGNETSSPSRPRRASEVRFTQKSITDTVDPARGSSGPQSFVSFLEKVLQEGPEHFPPPRLVYYENRWWSLDNHRLWALRIYEEENPYWDAESYFEDCAEVHHSNLEFANKKTTSCGGVGTELELSLAASCNLAMFQSASCRYVPEGCSVTFRGEVICLRESELVPKQRNNLAKNAGKVAAIAGIGALVTGVAIVGAGLVGAAVVAGRSSGADDSDGDYTSHSRRQRDLDNHANQCNPNNPRYEGYSSSYGGLGTRGDLNNHANQLNPNSRAYRSSRG